MKRICAWCRADLGEKDGGHAMEREITHTICPACLNKFLDGVGRPLVEFLDSLDVPVLAIEGEPRVRTANRKAQELLGKSLGEIEGQKGGDVIECVYAKKPGGCGGEEHCKSCTIRNTVLYTFATGESCVGVKAYPDILQAGQVRPMSLVITTEKVGELVLLRIDDLRPQSE